MRDWNSARQGESLLPDFLVFIQKYFPFCRKFIDCITRYNYVVRNKVRVSNLRDDIFRIAQTRWVNNCEWKKREHCSQRVVIDFVCSLIANNNMLWCWKYLIGYISGWSKWRPRAGARWLEKSLVYFSDVGQLVLQFDCRKFAVLQHIVGTNYCVFNINSSSSLGGRRTNCEWRVENGWYIAKCIVSNIDLVTRK